MSFSLFLSSCHQQIEPVAVLSLFPWVNYLLMVCAGFLCSSFYILVQGLGGDATTRTLTENYSCGRRLPGQNCEEVFSHDKAGLGGKGAKNTLSSSHPPSPANTIHWLKLYEAKERRQTLVKHFPVNPLAQNRTPKDSKCLWKIIWRLCRIAMYVRVFVNICERCIFGKRTMHRLKYFVAPK